ncbi:hypothetical protein [Streptomyces sp. NPDC049813]|uniref:hypothetical protein n=1 Tax=Streptomyces sp. NPDC049813 TaxID=3365597 RepID=UPI00379D7D38
MTREIDLSPLRELVGQAVRFESPWSGKQVSRILVEAGWEPTGAVSMPYAKRLVRAGFFLGIETEADETVLGVTLRQWSTGPQSDAVVADEYKTAIQECRELGARLIAALGRDFEIELGGVALDSDEYFFIHCDGWNIGNIHLVLGVEHVDPDDTPVEISLYLLERVADG